MNGLGGEGGLRQNLTNLFGPYLTSCLQKYVQETKSVELMSIDDIRGWSKLGKKVKTHGFGNFLPLFEFLTSFNHI